MTEPTEQLIRALKKHGQNVTQPRAIVFSTLQKHGPLTVSELVQYCGSGVNRASVYRTIKLYEQLGIIQRLQIGWKYRLELSNDFQHHHHHLYCVSCGNVTAMSEDHTLEDRLQLLARKLEFLPHDHQIEIRGLCSACQEKRT